MSHHRTKRQFAGASSNPSQRQITTFFASTTTTTTTSSSSTTTNTAPRANFLPAVPPAVQSSLINVGMRVRKSVPEGYKTGSPHGAFKLWDEGPAAAVVARAPAATYVAPRAAAGARELAPFCGMHSVGGFAAQPPLLHDLLPNGEEVDGLGLPGLTSSQETVDSVELGDSRKRSYEEEEEGVEIEDGMWSGGFMSLSPGLPGSLGSLGNRVVATAKGRSKGPAVGAQQGNVGVVDFEEADFLDERVFGGSA